MDLGKYCLKLSKNVNDIVVYISYNNGEGERQKNWTVLR